MPAIDNAENVLVIIDHNLQMEELVNNLKNTIKACAILCATCIQLFSLGDALAAEIERAHTHHVGNIEVILLPEMENESSSDLLIGADEAMLKEYLPGGLYQSAVNVFLIRNGDKNILVDTGFGKNLFRHLENFGAKPEDINAVLITHMHGDHIGGLLKDEQAAFPNANVYIAEQEIAYWGNLEEMGRQPENRQGGFKNAQNVLAALTDKLQAFSPTPLQTFFNDEPLELLPGIYPVAAFGHTPGHTAFLLKSLDQQILIWGDLTHAMAIQMPVPQIALTYDVDPQMAINTRLQILEYISNANIPVAGMHIPQSGMGTLTAKDTSYIFTYF